MVSTLLKLFNFLFKFDVESVESSGEILSSRLNDNKSSVVSPNGPFVRNRFVKMAKLKTLNP